MLDELSFAIEILEARDRAIRRIDLPNARLAHPLRLRLPFGLSNGLLLKRISLLGVPDERHKNADDDVSERLVVLFRGIAQSLSDRSEAVQSCPERR